MEPGIAIETRQLTKCYDGTPVVNSLSMVVPAGTITCLLGPNGSGKTTTVAMLTTLRIPSSGTGLVFGLDIVREAAAVRSSIGVALQHTGVDDLMTGREMLGLQATLQGMTKQAAQRRIDELVGLLGLNAHIDQRLATWSGGLRRRMDLAAALVHRPRLLFLDEPTTGLDPASRRSLWKEIRRLNRDEDVTIFLTTQHLEEADVLADTVSILQEGKLIVTATPDELKEGLGERTLLLDLEDPTALETAQGLVGGTQGTETSDRTLRVVVEGDDAPRHLATLTRAGIAVSGLTISDPTLEDVFLRLTD